MRLRPNLKQVVSVLKTLDKYQSQETMLEANGPSWTPFKILISTILSARAKDEVTEAVSKKLFKKYPTAKKLAKAPLKQIVKIIKPIGFYNVKAKNITKTAKTILTKFNGRVPKNFDDLVSLSGVGRKVANCVLAFAFDQPVIPTDTHVHRISNRLGWIKTKRPEQTEKELEKIIPKKYWRLINDVFVTHGKTICAPISPFCSKCPIYKWCKRIGIKRHR